MMVVSTGCTSTCGDSNPEPGEACDTGGDSMTCDDDCTAVMCGDGNLNMPAGEECDNGMANSDTTPDACRTTCEDAYCGDGVTDTGEECDDGNSTPGDGCTACVSDGMGGVDPDSTVTQTSSCLTAGTGARSAIVLDLQDTGGAAITGQVLYVCGGMTIGVAPT